MIPADYLTHEIRKVERGLLDTHNTYPTPYRYKVVSTLSVPGMKPVLYGTKGFETEYEANRYKEQLEKQEHFPGILEY